MFNMLIPLLLVALVALKQAACQDVEARTGSEKANLEGGQSRTIYGQRHLSPHRMMHFGKRPLSAQPPTISTSRVLDLYEPERRQPVQEQQPGRYPYLLSIELDKGHTLLALPEEPSVSDLQADYARRANLAYKLDQLQRQQPEVDSTPLGIGQQQPPQQFARLVKSPGSDESAPFLDDASDKAQTNDSQDNINVDSRSVPMTRGFNMPKSSYISALLFGRQGPGSLQNLGPFNKKAEPKSNLFMHFG